MSLDLFGDVSTSDDGARALGDFYETPAWMTRSLLRHHPFVSPTGAAPRVLECAAGRGAITRVLEAAGMVVIENDLDPAHGRRYQLDMRRRESWLAILEAEGGVDYVVTNLPFNVAIDILIPGLEFPLLAFVSLLLKSFDEPTLSEVRATPRGPWLSTHPWTRKICLPRHSFRGEGSPSMASDWFVWEPHEYHRRALPACVVDHLAKER